ncbi:hypothetical protein [Saliterribacillus persicus]|uniref:Phr family secreted Rap phosphatase inhibitor n=1 Tax=Saliterribacillus persicus TaxID=930114 RepID=A0A368YD74_9BACI|nr:hypothetical protein [Saliterribacillus persicus]RCW77388.1 hypothetical protein DFR57_101261 [Saliterribacillus persicus]
MKRKYLIIAIIAISLIFTTAGQATIAGNDADYPTSVTENF